MEFDKPITKIDQLYELQDSIEELTLSYAKAYEGTRSSINDDC